MNEKKNNDALRDVQRKVAEVMNKEDKKLVFGWRGETAPKLKEGETWEDATGRVWTMKNGIRQTVTKLDTAKTPWWCPKCNKPMNHRLDTKFWAIRGHCYDCTVKEESEMRRNGTWEEFERKTMLRNYLSALRDRIAELQEYHDTVTAPEFVNADDTRILMMERWDVDLDKIKADLMEEIGTLSKHLAETIAEHGTGE